VPASRGLVAFGSTRRLTPPRTRPLEASTTAAARRAPEVDTAPYKASLDFECDRVHAKAVISYAE